MDPVLMGKMIISLLIITYPATKSGSPLVPKQTKEIVEKRNQFKMSTTSKMYTPSNSTEMQCSRTVQYRKFRVTCFVLCVLFVY